jgi:AAA domain
VSVLNGNGKPLSAFTADWQARWVIEGLWQTRGVNMLCGAPRARKSTLNAYLTVCALTNTPAFGILPVTPIQRAAVFYGEGIPEAEATRFFAAFAGLNLDPALYADRLTIFGPQANIRFDPSNDLRSLRRDLQRDGYDLVSFDPLVNFHAQDENTSKMAVVMAQITAFTEFATVSLPHHVSKPSLEGPQRSLSHQARGHSSISGYTAVNLILERSGSSDSHTLRTDAKYTDRHGSLRLRFLDGIWLTEEVVQATEVQRKIAKLLFAEPNLTKTEIVKRLEMNRNRAFEVLGEMVEKGELTLAENGTYRYPVRGVLPQVSGIS